LFPVSSSDFRQIAHRTDRGRAERLFRAAVTAFCSLTRPSRGEIAQLEDLALPLFDSVSTDARRFVAAALSEAANPPAALVRRLADQTVDIAAPLLLRSVALTDVDLIALIGRHGVGHARVIARRQDLNPTIAQLIKALLRADSRTVTGRIVEPSQDKPMKPALPAVSETPPAAHEPKRPGAAAEAVREKLRAMMVPAASETPDRVRAEFAHGPRPDTYAKLKGTALTGTPALFRTALADALGIEFDQARTITARSAFGDLLAALKYLELGEEQAFVIAAALHPLEFGHAEAVRQFMRRYHFIHPEAAADKVRGWKEATMASALSRSESQAAAMPMHMPANSPGRPAVFGKALKAG
jgi:uncharacterized protein (DUF2336 family)